MNTTPIQTADLMREALVALKALLEAMEKDLADAKPLPDSQSSGGATMPRGGHMDEFWRELAMLDAQLDRLEGKGLRCIECDAIDCGERGWTLRLDVDGELVAFCPDCDSQDFGRA